MTEDENHAGSEGIRVPREPDDVELRKEARARALKNVAQAAFVVGLVLLLAFSAWTVVLIRDTQVGNRTTLQQAKNAASSAKSTADRIEDCTSPGGACFERAQRQTSGAVAGINTITVRAQACTLAITRQVPAGTKVNVDDVARQIEQCIKSSTVEVAPERVVPAPKVSTKPSSGGGGSSPKAPTLSGSTSSPHPASPGHTATPTPTASPSGTGVDLGPLCVAVPLVCKFP